MTPEQERVFTSDYEMASPNAAIFTHTPREPDVSEGQRWFAMPHRSGGVGVMRFDRKRSVELSISHRADAVTVDVSIDLDAEQIRVIARALIDAAHDLDHAGAAA